MSNLSKEELSLVLKALVEHVSKLERMKPYPLQKSDIKPYNDLIKKLVKARKASTQKSKK
jgi:hypothetical protein